jgi:hypothetical protein
LQSTKAFGGLGAADAQSRGLSPTLFVGWLAYAAAQPEHVDQASVRAGHLQAMVAKRNEGAYVLRLDLDGRALLAVLGLRVAASCPRATKGNLVPNALNRTQPPEVVRPCCGGHRRRQWGGDHAQRALRRLALLRRGPHNGDAPRISLLCYE